MYFDCLHISLPIACLGLQDYIYRTFFLALIEESLNRSMIWLLNN